MKTDIEMEKDGYVKVMPRYAGIVILVALLLAWLMVNSVSNDAVVTTISEPISETVVEPEVVQEEVKTIVSYEFHTGFTNPDNTDMQKEGYFDTKLKNQYVQWTGTVEEVTVSGRTVKLHVNHGDNFGGSALITLNDDQYSKAAQLHIGDTVTYTAKLIRWGSFLGFYGNDGVIV